MKDYIEIEIDKTCSVYYDKNQFYDLVSNFITNAVKYTPDDSVGNLKIHSDCKDDEIVLSFVDSGCGLVGVRDGFDSFLQSFLLLRVEIHFTVANNYKPS